jgi:hypothetical protein
LNDEYWHFLGLKPGASAAEISAARNRLSKLFHPDRGGTAEDMARLNEALEIVTGKRKSPSSGIFGKRNSTDAGVIALELEIASLKAQHEQELARRIQIETLLIQGHQAEVRRLKAERDAFELELAIRKSPVFPEIKCAAPGCVNMFRPSRRDATTCSAACRKALSRARRKAEIQPPDVREA